VEITRVEAVPLTTPYGMPGAQTRERSAVFVEVEVADGTVGVGETYLGCLHAGAGD
jgi:L-alanine-DL-glutamate epimerase-like enolase superfamily enzyme